MCFFKPLCGLLISFWVVTIPTYGQPDTLGFKQKVDTFSDSAWSHVRSLWKQKESQKADSLQLIYADKLFEMYRQNRKAKGAEEALQSAFAMWGNTGAVKQVKEAIPKIDKDSEVWSSILHSLGNAFGRSDQYEDYIQLLEELKEKLSHPKAMSKVLMELGSHYQHDEQKQKAKDYYKRVLELNASKFDSTKAEGNIYEIENLQVGMQAPRFSAVSVDGNTISTSNLKGQMVLLEFWGTWCGPCKPEIPHLKKVYKKYKNDDFQLLGIALDKKEKTVRNFTNKEGMKWPQIRESREWNGEITRKYNVNGIPDTYLLNRKGIIIAKDFHREEITQKVDEVMNGE